MSATRAFEIAVGSLRHVMVTSSRYKPEAQPFAQEFAATLEARGVRVTRDLEGTLPLAEVAVGAELMIVVGGDGTLLSAARRLAGLALPTIGVNLGKLGFLAEHSLADVRAYLTGEGTDGWSLSPKMMLRVGLENGSAQTITRYALNEVKVSQGVTTRLIGIDMDVDNQHATQYRADGLIISTPVGSTAYSLSLGGPILSQGLRAFLITPIAPHTLTDRPIVIEATRHVGFCVQSPVEELALALDTQEHLMLQQGDRFVISAAPTDFLLVSSGRLSYFDILRSKLAWGESPHFNPR